MASTYVIPFEKLYEEGYRGVIFDIDNTLVPHGAPADERAKKLFVRLKEIGFQSCLISNNQKPRVEMFNEEIGTKYICNAHKPLTKNYIRAMELMGTDRSNTLFVGGSAVYGCMGSQTRWNEKYSCETDPSEGGDPDRAQKTTGSGRSAFL